MSWIEVEGEGEGWIVEGLRGSLVTEGSGGGVDVCSKEAVELVSGLGYVS